MSALFMRAPQFSLQSDWTNNYIYIIMSVIDKSLEFLRPAQENYTHQQHEHDAIKCQDYPQWNLGTIEFATK